ncbi:MAG: COX15/CtaA family protein [Thaumarchaeota archaeon]|nr:COX15/CtaA family protein [Nitrososphaerota archaeon]
MQGRNALLGSTVVIVFSLLVVGAYVTAAGYGGLCGLNTPEDWPLCNGQLFPPPSLGPVIEYTHRILASLSGLFLIITALVFWRSKDAPSGAKKLIYLALVSVFVEIVIGGVVVNTNLSAPVVTLHQAFALLVFGFIVGATAVSFRKA